MKKILIAIALCFTVSTQSVTAQGTCDKLLVPDVVFSQKDIATDLSYLSIVTSSNFETHKRNASAGLDLPIAKGLLSGSANYNDFSQRREKKYNEYRFSYSHSDLSKFYERRLPEHIAKAFNECNESFGFQARLVGKKSILVEKEFHSW